jgi:hypothetical protein
VDRGGATPFRDGGLLAQPERLEVALMPSAEAPTISFTDEELARLRRLRRAFLQRRGRASIEERRPPTAK